MDKMIKQIFQACTTRGDLQRNIEFANELNHVFHRELQKEVAKINKQIEASELRYQEAVEKRIKAEEMWKNIKEGHLENEEPERQIAELKKSLDEYDTNN